MNAGNIPSGNIPSVGACVSRAKIYSTCFVFTVSGPGSLNSQFHNSELNGVLGDFGMSQIHKIQVLV